MVEITYSYKDGRQSIKVSGHANHAEYGKDLVCSAISSLIYSLADLILEVADHGHLTESPVIKLTPGDAEITCKPLANEEDVFTIKGAYMMAIRGFKLLSESYEENVRFDLVD